MRLSNLTGTAKGREHLPKLKRVRAEGWRDKVRIKMIERQAVQPDKGAMFLDDPKPAAGKRLIQLPGFLRVEVQRHLDAFVGPDGDAWVFVGPKGARPKRNNFHLIWNKARVAAGIPGLHLHDLRHTGNTLAAETGATLRELMDRMEHEGRTDLSPRAGRTRRGDSSRHRSDGQPDHCQGQQEDQEEAREGHEALNQGEGSSN